MPPSSNPTFRSSCNTRGWILAAPRSRCYPRSPTRRVDHRIHLARRPNLGHRSTGVWNFLQRNALRTERVPAGEDIMKIAQIAPLMESVPPRLYGGSERIVSYLTDELVRLGHDVTLFASGDSVSRANLVPCVPMALRLDANVRDIIPYYMLMLDRVRERADEFDILHFHIDQFHFPLFRPIAHRTVTTLHGRQDLHDLKPPYKPRGDYVAFLGRISPEKRPDRAILIARTLGIPIKIAAKVDKVDEAYFREAIAPLLDQPGVEYIGEIDERTKSEYLGDARALLFPIDWPEPFGLSM